MTQLTREGSQTDRPPLVDGTAAPGTVLIVDQLVAPIRAVLPELPIVIATGFSETEFGRRFQHDARVRVVGKPFDAPLLWPVLGSLDEQFA